MESRPVSNSVELLPSELYQFLRDQGIKYLQQICGEIWTDYNVHDPGITILELLCYALTDLDYRTSFPIEDLLTEKGNKAPSLTNSFHPAHVIFPGHPLTINDYRALLIDIPGVKNVWIETHDNDSYIPHIFVKANGDNLELTYNRLNLKCPHPLKLKGLYHIKIQLEDELQIKSNEGIKNELEQLFMKHKFRWNKVTRKDHLNIMKYYSDKIQAQLNSYRNLCEDFTDLTFLSYEEVGVCADIEISSDIADPEKILCEIYKLIDEYISPSIKFYSIDELVTKKKTMDEIFEGPLLDNGFLDYDELNKFNQRKNIYTSDLIHIIMGIPGIIAVRKILLSSYDEKGKQIFDGEKFCLQLSKPDQCTFILSKQPGDSTEVDAETGKTIRKNKNKIVFYKGDISIHVIYRPDACGNITSEAVNNNIVRELSVPEGRYRNLTDFYSIQNDFPKNYALGQEGISENVTEKRKAQRLQLKGYLLFFEQLLCNYLSQLDNAKNLLSWKKLKKTYFFQDISKNITGVKVLDKLLNTSDTNDGYVNLKKEYESNEEVTIERQNRLLNHLIARFCEQFADYSLLKYTRYIEDLLPGTSYTDEELINDKIKFLEDYPELSSNRSRSINYKEPAWDTYSNISGFQKRICRMLGIDDCSTRNLSSGNEEDNFDTAMGMYVVEHILLRPREKGQSLLEICCASSDFKCGENNPCADPYSMRITVVLPGWLKASKKMYFRNFVETIIRTEAPAHCGVKICWISQEQMRRFETAWKNFLESLKDNPDNNTYETNLHTLVIVLQSLKNIYPQAILYEWEESSTDKIPVRLDKSILGSTENNAN